MKILVFYILLMCSCGAVHTVKRIIHGRPGERESSVIVSIEVSDQGYLANLQSVTNNMRPIYSEFLFLCPAESHEDRELNQDHSKTKNALFIKRLHKNPNVIYPEEFVEDFNSSRRPDKEIIEVRCKHPVVPSIINIGQQKLDNPDINLYLVGYEVFRKEIKILAGKYGPAGITDDRFQWLNIYTIAFNYKTHDVVSVFNYTFNGYRFDTQPQDETSLNEELSEDYSLGKDIFYGEHSSITDYYKKEHQVQVFEELFKNKMSSNNYDFINWGQSRYLMGLHLAPLDSFGIPRLRLAGQMFSNMAPMWYFIYKNTWSKIETYVKYLVQALGGINVITGTYGTLTLFGEEIYLGPNKTVKVPATFWTIISYSRKEGQNYNILIVTNNNPYEFSENVICKKSRCRDFGWNNIEQEFRPLGLTTCCELTEQILTDLQINHCVRIDKTLNLNEVPHWMDYELTLNIKKYIENQIDGREINKPPYHDIYKNNKVVLDNEDEKFDMGAIFNIMYTNYVLPYLKVTYVPSTSFMLEENDQKLETPLVSDDENDEEAAGTSYNG